MLSSNTSAANGAANYIEDVFSTWLYTGTGASLTITNGIDLAGKGGLVWTKARSAANRHALVDTARGGSWELASNLTDGNNAISPATTFGATGYTMNDSATSFNQNGTTYASLTFREQPKFFDVVTYTGTGSSSQFVPHNLQSSYGFAVIKRTDSTSDWWVLARESSTPAYWQLKLNSTAAYTALLSPDPNTSTGFYPSSFDAGAYVNGATYVAYLFAHNAGGFGLTGTDNVISCGSYTTDASGNGGVTLGYEPQWLLVKPTDAVEGWYLTDNMRGMSLTRYGFVMPNTADAEFAGALQYFMPNATGFTVANQTASKNWIYIAIRRGPMKVPTTGTSVFNPLTWTGDGTSGRNVQPGNLTDLYFGKRRDTAGASWLWSDRLRGALQRLSSDQTAAESTLADSLTSFAAMNGAIFGGTAAPNTSGANVASYWIRRAPGFFDEVCYTGTGANQNVSHNLGVAPEMMIVKNRSNAANWRVYDAFNGPTKRGSLNDAQPWDVQSSMWNDASPTSTVFTVGTSNSASGQTYVAYLFATCPGVSKCTAFTGTGTLQTINCGFTSGARFVLIKRTDAAGDWYVWDSSRGLSSSNDPYLLLNSTAAEVTSTNWVDTTSTGFQVTAASGNDVNISGASYIALAIS